ncbi:rcc01693 family protein [Chachezhania antarctica]|uniref:rcc01693 family protein n=1 Tax=Chachezhania antarctica TaxID=2340860 RepID=UPI000EB2D1C5|nr:rcc01693 family protein [Chachezhania antarctica]|tara:strand:- start:2005 stop:2220 length:216 start_codon:yes stop_codon:yes gene_type:complete
MKRGFDWPALMRAGILGLRLEPHVFWRLTPAELRLMLGESGGQTPLGRAGLDALLAAYPDATEGERDAREI